MKIGFDAKRATQNFTGLGNYSRFVINNLALFYSQNTYCLFSPKPSVGNTEIIENPNITYSFKNGFKPFWRSLGITNNIQKEQIQLYHGLSNELPFGIQKTGAKNIVTIHDLIFLKHPEFYPLIDRNIYNIKARYACQKADRIVAVSECTKKDIIELYNIDPSKIDVVYQGCFPIFKKKVEDKVKEDVKKKHNLPARYLLSIGSIEDRKNILLIVKALKDIPNIHFVAIGRQRKYAEKVKAYAKQYGLEDRIHLVSGIPLNDLPAILQSSEIFIYPSLYEGFGIPIIEALCSGVPVIGATGSCLEEAGGPHSIYVNPYNEKELTDAINKILSEDGFRKNMISKGLEYVERFSDEECTDNLMKVYEKALFL